MLAQGLKATILRAAGSPEQYGAAAAADDVLAAGIAQSQHFLSLVAEGRIATRPWMERIDGGSVRFADGTDCRPDAILFGTGYRLSLPWLAPSIAAAIGIDRGQLELHDHTFHHELPGVAFLGLYDQVGPLLPVLELQARWIAQSFAGSPESLPGLTLQSVAQGVARARAARGGPQTVPMQAMALLFARNAGAEPELARLARDWNGRSCSGRCPRSPSGCKVPTACPMRQLALRAPPQRSAPSDRRTSRRMSLACAIRSSQRQEVARAG